MHTIAHKELMAKLRSLTNVRAVRDATSSTGYRIAYDRFPGWKNPPTW